MIAFQLVAFYFAICDVSEGNTIQAIIGRNVSFSFIFTNKTIDSILILHDSSLFLSVWPAKQFFVAHDRKERVQVSVDLSARESMIVTINLFNITTNDVGIYSVKHQRNYEAFKESIRLQAIDKTRIPRIDIVRYNVSDSSLQLQCLSATSYEGNIFWKINAYPIKHRDRYNHDNEYLLIRNLTADDQNNSYTCKEHESGLESDPYILNSSGPSVITVGPNETLVMEQDSLNISCVSDCDHICTYRWMKLETLLGSEKYISAGKALQLNNITRHDAGIYGCKVQNVIRGTTYAKFLSLDVVYGPDELLLNASNEIIELDKFDSLAIFCSADCFPPCHIHWSESSKYLSGGAELKINNVQKDGNFTCHARNPRNANNSISITISAVLKSADRPYSTTVHNRTDYTEAAVLQINRLLIFLVIGMGILIVVGFCICLLKKFLKWQRLDRTSNNVQFQDGAEEIPLQASPSEGYWTIVSNAEGHLSTAMEININQINKSSPIANIPISEINKVEASAQFLRMEVGIELDGYIHAIPSDHVITCVESTNDTLDV